MAYYTPEQLSLELIGCHLGTRFPPLIIHLWLSMFTDSLHDFLSFHQMWPMASVNSLYNQSKAAITKWLRLGKHCGPSNRLWNNNLSVKVQERSYFWLDNENIITVHRTGCEPRTPALQPNAYRPTRYHDLYILTRQSCFNTKRTVTQ